MQRFCLALDLRDDPQLIREYEEWHKPGGVWKEVLQSIRDAGIIDMEIYRIGNRLIMILEASDSFTLANKAEMDLANPKVQEWETMMGKFQQMLPWAKERKWEKAEKVFALAAH